MRSELADLYQEVILDHNRRPRNFTALAPANRTAEGYNPLCGDRVTVYVDLAGGRLREVAFQGSGCAISTASASIMTEALRGKTVAEARELFRKFQRLVTTGRTDMAQERGAADVPAPDAGDDEDLGELAAFGGVHEFPMRVKCATLAWHALQSALAQRAEEGEAP